MSLRKSVVTQQTKDNSRHELHLLVACRLGDEEAARQFHVLMFPVLVASANRVLHDRELAEDAAQNAMLRMLRTPLLRVRMIRDPRAWLVTVVTRESLMLRRTSRRAHSRELASVTEKRDAEISSDRFLLHDAIDSLSDPLREVLLLKHGKGMTFDEMARATSDNRDTLASRYKRAIGLIRARLVESRTPEKLDER